MGFPFFIVPGSQRCKYCSSRADVAVSGLIISKTFCQEFLGYMFYARLLFIGYMGDHVILLAVHQFSTGMVAFVGQDH